MFTVVASAANMSSIASAVAATADMSPLASRSLASTKLHVVVLESSKTHRCKYCYKSHDSDDCIYIPIADYMSKLEERIAFADQTYRCKSLLTCAAAGFSQSYSSSHLPILPSEIIHKIILMQYQPVNHKYVFAYNKQTSDTYHVFRKHLETIVRSGLPIVDTDAKNNTELVFITELLEDSEQLEQDFNKFSSCKVFLLPRILDKAKYLAKSYCVKNENFILWKNNKNIIHREEGPALIEYNSDEVRQYWVINGRAPLWHTTKPVFVKLKSGRVVCEQFNLDKTKAMKPQPPHIIHYSLIGPHVPVLYKFLDRNCKVVKSIDLTQTHKRHIDRLHGRKSPAQKELPEEYFLFGCKTMNATRREIRRRERKHSSPEVYKDTVVNYPYYLRELNRYFDMESVSDSYSDSYSDFNGDDYWID